MRFNHTKPVCALLAALFLVLVGTGCEETPLGASDDVTTSLQPASAGRLLDHRAACDLSNEFTLEIDNEFLPFPVGRQWVLEGVEDGEAIRIQITVLNETEVVGGVVTRVVEEREWVGPSFNKLKLIERSNNFYAQNEEGRFEGTICYFGEDVFPAKIGGIWRADNPNSFAGIFMPRDPKVGMVYLQEDAPTARDLAGHIGENETVITPYGTFTETILVNDCNTIEEPGCDPLAGDGGLKVYAAGVGYIVDGPTQLVSFTPGAASVASEGDNRRGNNR